MRKEPENLDLKLTLTIFSRKIYVSSTEGEHIYFTKVNSKYCI